MRTKCIGARGARRRSRQPHWFGKFSCTCLLRRGLLLIARNEDSTGISGKLGRSLLALAAASLGIVLAGQGLDSMSQEAAAARNQAAEYAAAKPKSILELQQFRQTNLLHIRSGKGADGTAMLVNLNPTINAWYLLKVAWQGGSESSYHLENPEPHSRKLTLDANYPLGIQILEGKARYSCNLFGDASLEQARNSQLFYAPLCDARLYLRNPAKGHQTNLEAAAEVFRDRVWGGEKVITVLHHVLGDTHRETADIHDGGSAVVTGDMQGAAPLPALIDAKYADRLLTPSGLGIALEASAHSGLRPGAWYSASGSPGIYVSLIAPQLIDSTILQSHKTTVNNLDTVEASALCYLIAFDLDRYELAYALGTDHPAVDWSEHIQRGVKDAKLPGPDGIGTISPLVSAGLISPEYAQRTAATFIGGFKRYHGAFKYGELASKNYGSHYGFLEDGVVFSKLQPGLATIFVLNDGSIQMKTWEAQDEQILAKVKYARQNGVPIVEFDDRSHSTVPGQLVNQWGPGNWSGSEDVKLRTMRSGIALQTNGRKRFLIYAVFSDATPSAMTRVFQAYRFRYGMPLDMNALEHTYCALYRRAGSQLVVDYLITGMSQVEKSASGQPVPRFLVDPDNRDFFYLMRRNE